LVKKAGGWNHKCHEEAPEVFMQVKTVTCILLMMRGDKLFGAYNPLLFSAARLFV